METLVIALLQPTLHSAQHRLVGSHTSYIYSHKTQLQSTGINIEVEFFQPVSFFCLFLPAEIIQEDRQIYNPPTL